jgi:hypothetical protein
MKFSDILEDRRRNAEPYSEKQLDILSRGNRWNSATDFLINDPEGYEEMRILGLTKILGREWNRIPKSSEDLIRLGKNYKSFKEFRNYDRSVHKSVEDNNEVHDKLFDFYIGERFSTKEQIDLINRGLKWKSATDFLVNDPEGFRDSVKYGVREYLGRQWSKIEKTREDLLYYGKQYQNSESYKLNDIYNFKLTKSDNELMDELNKFWSESYNNRILNDLIKRSKEKFKMDDIENPNDISKLVPRFNYDKLLQTGLEFDENHRLLIPPNTIYCKRHHIYFPEEPKLTHRHLEKGEHSGCPKCGKEELATLRTLESESRTIESFWKPKFIENSANRFPSISKRNNELKYDYSKSWLELRDVKSNDTENVKRSTFIHNIKCKIHKITFATDGIRARTHAVGRSGCPKCSGSESIGEDRMNGILINIFGTQDDVKKQKVFPGLIFQSGLLKFDRYVEVGNKKICFEFDGEQHFYKNLYFHKDDIGFYKSIAHDTVKNNYCKQNNIKLIRIGHLDSNNMEIEIKNALENPSQMVLSSRYPQLGWNTPDMKKNDPYLYRYLKQYKVIGESDLKLLNLI